MNANSAFTGSHTEDPFFYQQLGFRLFRITRSGQPMVEFDAAVNCSLYVTRKKAVIFQVDIPSITKDNLEDHSEILLRLTSLHEAT